MNCLDRYLLSFVRGAGKPARGTDIFSTVRTEALPLASFLVGILTGGLAVIVLCDGEKE